jgi:hypothetical protein
MSEEHSKKAKEVPRAILVAAAYRLDNEQVLETPCADFDRYSKLPMVVAHRGLVYGLTGWNSDTGRAFYKSSAKVAYG